jgi:hypothetical protein
VQGDPFGDGVACLVVTRKSVVVIPNGLVVSLKPGICATQVVDSHAFLVAGDVRQSPVQVCDGLVVSLMSHGDAAQLRERRGCVSSVAEFLVQRQCSLVMREGVVVSLHVVVRDGDVGDGVGFGLAVA